MRRVSKFYTYGFLASVGLMGTVTTVQAKERGEDLKPNVIFILTDDQGVRDLGCYGAKDIATPNLDQLAQNGVKFTQFYVGSSICSPSRASLLTGKNPHAAELPSNTSSQPGHAGMPSHQETIAEVFKKAGYATGHVGKWHLGYTGDTRPMNQGFDYTFGHMGGCIDNYSHFFYWEGPNRHDLWENGKEIYNNGKYFPDMMVDRASNFIEQNVDQPFFLYYAMNTPHYPLQPTKKWRDYYKNLPMPRRDYAAFVSTTDERIGKLLDVLKKQKILENTIVVFMSDHGHSCETRTFGGGGSAGVYRGCKFSFFEGGIRVPAIISWKGSLPENKSNNEFLLSVDWLPTLADLCGINSLPDGLEGESLVPVITKGKKSAHKSFIWKLGKSWAVREGDWKLLGNPRDQSNKYPIDEVKDALFLANLKMDPSESVNLANRYPEMVSRLLAKYKKWKYANRKDIPSQITEK